MSAGVGPVVCFGDFPDRGVQSGLLLLCISMDGPAKSTGCGGLARHVVCWLKRGYRRERPRRSAGRCRGGVRVRRGVADRCSGSMAMHSARVRRAGAGARMTATGTLEVSMTTSTPARTFAIKASPAASASEMWNVAMQESFASPTSGRRVLRGRVLGLWRRGGRGAWAAGA